MLPFLTQRKGLFLFGRLSQLDQAPSPGIRLAGGTRLMDDVDMMRILETLH